MFWPFELYLVRETRRCGQQQWSPVVLHLQKVAIDIAVKHATCFRRFPLSTTSAHILSFVFRPPWGSIYVGSIYPSIYLKRSAIILAEDCARVKPDLKKLTKWSGAVGVATVICCLGVFGVIALFVGDMNNVSILHWRLHSPSSLMRTCQLPSTQLWLTSSWLLVSLPGWQQNYIFVSPSL